MTEQDAMHEALIQQRNQAMNDAAHWFARYTIRDAELQSTKIELAALLEKQKDLPKKRQTE